MMRILPTVLLLTAFAACNGDFADPDREFGPAVDPSARPHPVEIHHPTTLGVADTPKLDAAGRPIGVACKTCHGPDPASSMAAAPGHPTTFHSAVDLTHGNLNCNSCHSSSDRTKLHLADGELLELGAAMTLCAQCHGVQHRDYQHGSHGGMNGYWDLKRGPRLRNHCVDCHAPHAPAYESVLPVHPPRDRYLETPHEPAQGGH